MLGIFRKADAPQFELFCCSVRGASHIRKETPCEDSGIKLDMGDIKIFAVADGHGDPNCVRSRIGSEYACKIAGEALESFARSVAANGFESRLFDKAECAVLMDRLIRSIVGKWISSVDEELSTNPLTDEEYNTAFRLGDEYRKGIKIERMYGTTLIAGLLTEKYLLLLQQGDGRCVVFNSDGTASQPIPWDDRCVGTATTSLCDADAAGSVRYHVINLEENPVIACIAGTDGVEDSFPTSMEKTHAYYRNMIAEACELGTETMEQALANDLSDLSRQGSADDVTVSGIIDVRRARKFMDEFEAANLIINTRDELAVVNSQIKSMESGGMLEHLSKLYDGLALSYRTTRERFEELDRQCSELAEKIAAHEQEVPEADKVPSGFLDYIAKLRFSGDLLAPARRELERLTVQRDEAKREYDEASAQWNAASEKYLPRKKRYDALLAQKADIIKRLSELEGSDGSN